MSPVTDGALVVVRGVRWCLRVDGFEEFEGVLLVGGGDGVEGDGGAALVVRAGPLGLDR